MDCTYCGMANSDDAYLCAYCGSRLGRRLWPAHIGLRIAITILVPLLVYLLITRVLLRLR